ncbi:MAG: hypothetical protein KDJ31_19390, partial [Candidatus Competibacteraceae bacterium]|nr:hypothetical protein [Candidatus Competibacteraceae bacterium]
LRNVGQDRRVMFGNLHDDLDAIGSGNTVILSDLGTAFCLPDQGLSVVAVYPGSSLFFRVKRQ